MYNNQAKPGGQLTTITEATSKDSGFFGRIKEIGLEVIQAGAELVPIWAAQQLKEQQEDQLNRPTFDPEGQPRPVWQAGPQTYETQKAVVGMNAVLFNLGPFPVTSGGLLAMSVALLATMLIAKKVF